MARLSVILSDITRLEVDAIVNAANEWLLGAAALGRALDETRAEQSTP